MKPIQIFGIVLFVVLLAVAVAFACDAQKTTLDNAQKRVNAVESEVENRARQNGWWDIFVKYFPNQNVVDDIEDMITDTKERLALLAAQEELAEAKANRDTAQKAYDDCKALTEKVNNIKLMAACGVHEEGTAGNHKKVLCPIDAKGQSCTLGPSYLPCQGSHTHTYPKPVEKLACGHAVGAPGDHNGPFDFWWCGHTVYSCQIPDHASQTCPV
ncbi:MAG: hypothetical protein OXI24_21135, partial [Candidatus Poribacteria bacterium]|nr:hypothetical protein [Candidatus Poribacteria bacterium]